MGEANPYLNVDQNLPQRREAVKGWEARGLNIPIMNPVTPEGPNDDEPTRMPVPEMYDDIPMVEITEEASLYNSLAREVVTDAVMDRKLDIDYLPIEGDTTDPIQKIMNNIDAQLAEMKSLIESTYGAKVGTVVESAAPIAEVEATSVTSTLEPTVYMGEVVEEEAVGDNLAVVIPFPRANSDQLYPQPQAHNATESDDFLDESWYRAGGEADTQDAINIEQDTNVIAMPEKGARHEKKAGRARKWLGRAAVVGLLTAGVMTSGMNPAGHNDGTGNPTIAAFEIPGVDSSVEERVDVAPTPTPTPEATPATSSEVTNEAAADAAYDGVTLSEWGQANGITLDQIRQAVEAARVAGEPVTTVKTADGAHEYYKMDDSENGGEKDETRTSKLAKFLNKYIAKVRTSTTNTQ